MCCITKQQPGASPLVSSSVLRGQRSAPGPARSHGGPPQTGPPHGGPPHASRVTFEVKMDDFPELAVATPGTSAPPASSWGPKPHSQGPPAQGPQTRGPPTQGAPNQGPQTIPGATQGPQTRGPQSQGPQTRGLQSQGPQTRGLHTQGPVSSNKVGVAIGSHKLYWGQLIGWNGVICYE